MHISLKTVDNDNETDGSVGRSIGWLVVARIAKASKSNCAVLIARGFPNTNDFFTFFFAFHKVVFSSIYYFLLFSNNNINNNHPIVLFN